ncbi:YmfQ family protein [Filifactor villosus]|uniref:YmfQ family protein n=1 Tax=Filifactor villosus TaxID=29374 RepID=A0ABV9QPU0_9FIRM
MRKYYGATLYGASTFANSLKDEVQKEECYLDLMKYLPRYWQQIKEMIMLQRSLGFEVGELECSLNDLFDQFFVEKATWGLSMWEEELGLPVNPNRNHEARRELIKAKLRGAATTTSEMIRLVARAFSGGEVEVVEHNDRYTFEIKFVGIKGIPRNMNSFKSTIEEIKPAHLAVEYSYTYTVWKEVKRKTWSELFNTRKVWADIKNNDL